MNPNQMKLAILVPIVSVLIVAVIGGGLGLIFIGTGKVTHDVDCFYERMIFYIRNELQYFKWIETYPMHSRIHFKPYVDGISFR